MSQSLLDSPARDLRVEFPRSPNELLGDYIILARIIDKCRALIAGTNGEYSYNCPLDRRFFDFTLIDADAFKEQVAAGLTDPELLEWVQTHSTPKTLEELQAWGYQSRWARPIEPEWIAFFEGKRREISPNKPYLETWFQLLDAEEGRL